MENLPKEKQIFVKEVAIHGNATKAVRKAFKDIKDPGYQRIKAHRLITDDNIVKAVDEVKQSIADRINDDDLVDTHKQLLNSRRLDHMVFPLGPKDEKNEPQANLAPEIKTIMEAQQELERTHLTDEDITQLINEANCVLRKIVHGTNARHVYFWAPDNIARDKALDKGYKLKGVYAPEKSISLNLNGDIIPTEELLELANQLKKNEVTRIDTREDIGRNGADTESVGEEVQD